MEATASADSDERIVGPYRILRELGRGGHGVVYAGEHIEHGYKVAIKEIPEGSNFTIRRIHRETEALKALEDVGGPKLWDFFRDVDALYVVMEYLSGETLAQRLSRGPMSDAEAVSIVAEAAEVLSKAHRIGLIHRDLKPSNIFLCPEEPGQRVRVIDFGLAVSLSAVGDLTGAGVFLGTPQYASPEQCFGTYGINGRTDIYSLGVVLYQMLSGELPFADTNSTDVMSGQMSSSPPHLSEHRHDVDETLNRVVMKCLEKDPDDRHQTMIELAQALRGVLEGLDGDESFRLPLMLCDGDTESLSPETVSFRVAESKRVTQIWAQTKRTIGDLKTKGWPLPINIQNRSRVGMVLYSIALSALMYGAGGYFSSESNASEEVKRDSQPENLAIAGEECSPESLASVAPSKTAPRAKAKRSARKLAKRTPQRSAPAKSKQIERRQRSANRVAERKESDVDRGERNRLVTKGAPTGEHNAKRGRAKAPNERRAAKGQSGDLKENQVESDRGAIAKAGRRYADVSVPTLY